MATKYAYMFLKSVSMTPSSSDTAACGCGKEVCMLPCLMPLYSFKVKLGLTKCT